MRMLYSMKRKVALVVACIVCLLTASAAEATIIAQGECGAEGSSVQWKYDNTGTLTISGTGAMADFSVGASPWYDYETEITTVVVENGVTYVGKNSFRTFDNLTTATIADSVEKIGGYAFYSSSKLESVKLSNNLTYISQRAFGYCSSLASIVIPKSVTYIEGEAFIACSSLTSIEIPDGIEEIGSELFSGCSSLTSIKLSDTITRIGSDAFHGCSSLASITLPDDVSYIGSNAFWECSNLAEIKLPKSLEKIGTYTFYCCSSLKSIIIPNSVKEIGALAFAGCSNLSIVHYLGTEEQWASVTIGSSNEKFTDADRHYCTEKAEIAPTCQAAGNESGWYCETCANYIEGGKAIEINPDNHIFVKGFCACGVPCDHKDSTLTPATNNVITESCSKCKVPLGTASITATDATYDGTAQETATVAYGTGWTGDRNLTVTYANNVDAGTATASITIGGVTARTTFTIQPKEITGAAVAIEQGASFVYSGEPFTPAVSVTLDGKPLAASDYQVSYAGNVNAGQAMVTVTGRGNYSGSATATFTIAKAPAPTLPAATVSRNYAVAKVSVPTGIVAGEGSSVSVGTASGSGSDKVADVILDAKGNLTFTLSGGANGDEIVLPVHLHYSPNYEGPITATVTVTLTDKLDQRPLTVKATSTTVLSGGTLELSIAGGSGKGAVTYEVINGTGSASLSGSTLTGGAPGTVTVIATKAGTSQYNPARSQPLVVTIE